jgi:hypothetical protein
MTITFENENDIIVYAFERIISFARENQYLFVANCIWWISGVIGLESGLSNHIDNLESRKEIHQPRGVSSTPRDIASDVSPEDTPSNYVSGSLRKVRKGRINPTPKSKRPLKKARKAKNRKERKLQTERLASGS